MTLTDVLKILTDNLYTTIETVNTTVQSVITTIYTVQGLIGTVTDQGNSIGNLNGRVTALENAPSADSKVVIYEGTMAYDSDTGIYTLTLSNSKTLGDIATDYFTNHKAIIVRGTYSNIAFDFTVNRISQPAGLQMSITMSALTEPTASSFGYLSTHYGDTFTTTMTSVQIYYHTI